MKTIAFYNLKGGVGKTAAAVNIAWHAARWKHPVLLWDLDPQAATCFYLGVEGGKTYRAGNLVTGRQSLERLRIRTRWEGLDVIPADQSLRNLDVKLADAPSPRQALRRLLKPMEKDYSLVMLDCPPTLSPVAESIFAAADHVVVPVIPTHLSIRALEQVREWMKDRKLERAEVLPFFNMVDRRRLLHVEMLVTPPKAMKGGLRTWVPYSTHVERMGEHRAPVGDFAPHTPAARAFRGLWFELAERIGL